MTNYQLQTTNYKLVITGSLAYDHILVYSDRFKNHILPEKLHMLNVSFTANQLRKEFGGTAGNIAYNVHLLDHASTIHATAGNDFSSYKEWLEKNNISTSSIKVLPNNASANAYITTDLDDNQISAFYGGAMLLANQHPLTTESTPQESLVIIAPNEKDAMLSHAKFCQTNNIPFIFDPGQALPAFTRDELKQAVEGSILLILNDYEWELWKEKTDLNEESTLQLTKNIIITLGEKGSTLLSSLDSKLSSHSIPAIPNIPVVDPTGCGDAYRAGLMVGLADGLKMQEAAKLGTVAASFCVSSYGTQNHRFTKDQFKIRYHQAYNHNQNPPMPNQAQLTPSPLASSLPSHSTNIQDHSLAFSFPSVSTDTRNQSKTTNQSDIRPGLIRDQSMHSEVKDLSLAPQGMMQIEFAEQHMGALMEIKRQFEESKPFRGYTIGMALHVTKETAVLVRTLKAGGAKVVITGCNPLSTQDDVAAALLANGDAIVFAYKGETKEDYYRYLNKVIEVRPDITIDDGCDLVTEIHRKHPHLIDSIIGGCEETTTGIIRLQAMQKDQALKYPIIAVNDNKTKHLMDNYYGTGQSTLDGIIRSTNILFAGKTVVIVGYGSCGKGTAMRAKGLGANVIVTEVDNFAALQAKMDGFRVMPLLDAALEGDIFITVTGNLHVIDRLHMEKMKDGAILANSGHFDNEINLDALREMTLKTSREATTISPLRDQGEGIRRVRHYLDEYTLTNGQKLFIAGEGRLVNLASAEGHPSEVMSLSFCGQALACKYLVDNRGTLKPEVIQLPPEIDDYIASLQLKAMNTNIDQLTPEQISYLSSWQHGT